jgi:iron complex transport system substrate-binding protein
MVRLSGPAKRVVSLAPSITEMVCALGCDSVLAGVSSFCDFPPSVFRKPKVGDLLNPSLEAILSLRPDLVLISVEGNSRETYSRLLDLQLPVFVSSPRTIADVLASITNLGALLGCPVSAQHLTDSLSRFREVLSRPPRPGAPSVLMLIATDPLIVAGGDTFLDEMIRLSGARNAGDGGRGRYPALNREEILRRNPDVLLYSSDLHLSHEAILHLFPEWRRLSAFTRGRCEEVDASLFLRPGPRLFRGLRSLRGIVDSLNIR